MKYLICLCLCFLTISANAGDTAGVEIKDNRLPFTSKWNIAAPADYVVAFSSGQLNVHIDADYQSEFYFDQNQCLYYSKGLHALAYPHGLEKC